MFGQNKINAAFREKHPTFAVCQGASLLIKWTWRALVMILISKKLNFQEKKVNGTPLHAVPQVPPPPPARPLR